MIIKEIELKNYMCYYGTKRFEFKNGLNIVLGKNGDGKTKLYEAIDWLFSGSGHSKTNIPSAKAIHQMVDGDTIIVSASLRVDQTGEEKILKREYIVSLKNGELEYSNPKLTGIETNLKGERSQVDGEMLKQQIFDERIRRYSMFKGEEELRILDNPDSLDKLVNLFSDSRYYEQYIKTSKLCFEKAERAVTDDAKKNKTNGKRLNILEAEIDHLKRSQSRIKGLANARANNIEIVKKKLKETERFVQNAESLDIIKKRIAKLEKKIAEEEQRIHTCSKFTTSLFDNHFLSIHFEPIHTEYMKKVTDFSKERRKQQSLFDKELGKKEGEKKIKEELLGFLPLPIGTPSKAHMVEMLDDHLCKVCNTDAPEGSEPYIYMKKRLEEFLKSQQLEETAPKKLYNENYTSKLVAIGEQYENDLIQIRGIESDIQMNFEFIESRRKDLGDLREKLEKEKEERDKIIGGSAIGEDSLQDVLLNYNGFQKDYLSDSESLRDEHEEMAKIKENLTQLKSEKTAIEQKQVNQFLLDTKEILSDISNIVNDTKNDIYSDFISKLELKADALFKETNKGSFTGIEIKLYNSKNEEFVPNKGQENMMNVSVLLAISSLLKDKQEESYPIIMDAPTSTFDNEKMKNFYKAMKENSEQSIILSKDFILKDENGVASISDGFTEINCDKAFWIKLSNDLVDEQLYTVNTQVHEI